MQVPPGTYELYEGLHASKEILLTGTKRVECCPLEEKGAEAA